MTDLWMDMHVHTRYSDGLLAPEAIVAEAARLGLSAVGITDHDAIDGIPQAMEAGERLGIEVIPGVELSSQARGRDLHILGYYFDTENPDLREYLALFCEERRHRAEAMVLRLNRAGIRIQMEEVESKSYGRAVGRPHIAEVLIEKGYVETFQEAFRCYLGYGADAYVEKYKISPQEAIALIAGARGLAFLAHPGPSIPDEMLVELVKAGLDGIEVIHPTLTCERSRKLQAFARAHGLLVSGGSDSHGGREGEGGMGRYTVPYGLLGPIKSARQDRWGISEPGKRVACSDA